MNERPTVADYIVGRLAREGITDCFGVAGDFAFKLCDAVARSEAIRWIGCSNELDAAYAADGYARVRGCSMLLTTYAVGELSALNGVMGARAERSAQRRDGRQGRAVVRLPPCRHAPPIRAISIPKSSSPSRLMTSASRTGYTSPTDGRRLRKSGQVGSKNFGYTVPRRQAIATPGGEPSDPITAATLYPRYRDLLKPRDRIVLESGSLSSGMIPLPLPEDVQRRLTALGLDRVGHWSHTRHRPRQPFETDRTLHRRWRAPVDRH